MKSSEWNVVPVTRYIVEHAFSEDDENGRGMAGCQTYGEFDNERTAIKVAEAMKRLED